VAGAELSIVEQCLRVLDQWVAHMTGRAPPPIGKAFLATQSTAPAVPATTSSSSSHASSTSTSSQAAHRRRAASRPRGPASSAAAASSAAGAGAGGATGLAFQVYGSSMPIRERTKSVPRGRAGGASGSGGGGGGGGGGGVGVGTIERPGAMGAMGATGATTGTTTGGVAEGVPSLAAPASSPESLWGVAAAASVLASAINAGVVCFERIPCSATGTDDAFRGALTAGMRASDVMCGVDLAYSRGLVRAWVDEVPRPAHPLHTPQAIRTISLAAALTFSSASAAPPSAALSAAAAACDALLVTWARQVARASVANRTSSAPQHHRPVPAAETRRSGPLPPTVGTWAPAVEAPDLGRTLKVATDTWRAMGVDHRGALPLSRAAATVSAIAGPKK
jgi:hypothetical protein